MALTRWRVWDFPELAGFETFGFGDFGKPRAVDLVSREQVSGERDGR